MRRHWQKRPLCVPRALTDDAGLIDQDGLFALAQREDVPSRLVMRSGRRWTVRHGPFRRAELKRLPARGWSLLVQGVDQVDARAARLLRRFSFLPYARLDDVMVSYAPPGGGVGPHFDSYDVFLLQGAGRRRWQVSAQRDLALVPDAPLRIYLDAAPNVRARRRAEQLRAAGRAADEAEILRGILERDRIDSGRSEGPLRVPDGAERVDTSGLDLEGVVSRLESLARTRLGDRLARPAAAAARP